VLNLTHAKMEDDDLKKIKIEIFDKPDRL